MCIVSTPTPPPIQMPTERAAAAAPDKGAATSGAARRQTDALRGASPTILTSGSGVTETAPTGKKTLLGQ